MFACILVNIHACRLSIFTDLGAGRAPVLSALTVGRVPAKVPPHVATDPRSGQERGGVMSRREWVARLRSSADLGGLHARSGDPKDGDAYRRAPFLTGRGGSWTISPPVRRARGRGGRRFRW